MTLYRLRDCRQTTRLPDLLSDPHLLPDALFFFCCIGLKRNNQTLAVYITARVGLLLVALLGVWGDVSGRIWVPAPIKEDPITVCISAPRLQDPPLHTFFYPSLYSAGEHHTYAKHLFRVACVRKSPCIQIPPPSGATCPHLSELFLTRNRPFFSWPG